MFTFEFKQRSCTEWMLAKFVNAKPQLNYNNNISLCCYIMFGKIQFSIFPCHTLFAMTTTWLKKHHGFA